MALKEAMQGRTCEMENCILQGVKTIVQGQEGMLSKRHARRFFFDQKAPGAGVLGAHRQISRVITAPPLLHRLGIHAVLCCEFPETQSAFLYFFTNFLRRAGPRSAVPVP